MDYCAAKNQIKSYAPTSAGSTLFAKNIDCGTLDADYIGCSELSINGVPITGITDVTNKTQNILDTTSSNNTIIQGTLEVPDVETTRITAIDPTAGLTLNSKVDQNISTSTGGITLYLTNASLGTASTNYMGFAMGTSKTSSNNAWQMLYYNTTSGSSNNRLEFKMMNQFTPTLSMIQGKVGIANAAPTEALDVTGNAKVSANLTVGGTLAVTGASTFTNLIVSSLNIISTNKASTTAFTNTTTATLTGIGTAATTINFYLYDVGISTNGAIGLRIGSSTTPSTAVQYISTTGSISLARYKGSNGKDSNFYIAAEMGNAETLVGKITLNKVVFPGQTTFWNVEGILKADGNVPSNLFILGGVITYTGGIGCIGINSSGNFNVSGSYIAAEWY